MSTAAGPREIAGLSIEVATTPADAALISTIFDEVWSVRAMVSPEIMVAALHNGAYGAIAWRDGQPVGPRSRSWGFRLPVKAHPICTHTLQAWLQLPPTGALVTRSSCISFLGQDNTDLAL
jgi:hypothetical protein